MVPSLDDVMCLFSCWFSCHSEPLQAWKQLRIIYFSFFLFWPSCVFITDFSPSKSSLSGFSLLPGHQQHPIESAPLKKELICIDLILSYTVHFLSFWKLLLSCVLHYHSIQIFPTLELLGLTGSHFTVLWSSHFHSFVPFPKLHYEHFKGQTQNLLTVLSSPRELSNVFGAYGGLWLITGL